MEKPLIYLLIVLAIAYAGVVSGCPSGFDQVGGTCLQRIHLDGPSSFDFGREHCLTLSSGDWAVDLAVIKTYEEAEAFSTHLTETGPANQAYLVGVEFVNGGWHWVDGAPINLKSTVWMPGKPEPHPSHEREVLFAPVDPYHRYYFTSEAGAHAVLCQASLFKH